MIMEEILGEACWKGYHKQGMKKMFGKKYPNCVKNESEEIEEFIDVNKAPENFDVYADSNGSDYDFTVGKTKIEVTFKEYNENYYILAFENTTQRRPDTHAATGTERDTVFGIFNGVAYCLNHFIARHPKTEVIVMGAKSNELSRVKLYDRAAKFFEQMGFKAVTDPVQQKRIFNDDASGYKLYIYKKKNAMEMTTEGRTGLGGLSTATSRAHQASRFGHDPDRAAPVYRPNKDGYIAPRNGSGDESNIILQLKKNLDRAVGKPLSFQDGSVLEIRPKTARQALSIIADMRPVERHETIKNIMQSKDAFIGFVKSQNNSVDEAANAAQQAAIAIAKKKDKGVDENFADGKGPGRPGDSARHGIPKHATKAELEKASHAKGRKGQLARWQINMRNGKNK